MPFHFIKTRFDILMFALGIIIAIAIFVIKVLPENFSLFILNNNNKNLPLIYADNDSDSILSKKLKKERQAFLVQRIIPKSKSQVKVDYYATTYLRAIWILPDLMPIFNSSVIGGYYNISIISTKFFTSLIKKVSHKERPDKSDFKSFPSGHTSGAFVFAGFLHKHFSPLKASPFYLFAAVVGGSRIYCLKHDIYDIVAGAFVGIFFGYFSNSIALFLMNKICKKIVIINKIYMYLNSPLRKNID